MGTSDGAGAQLSAAGRPPRPGGFPGGNLMPLEEELVAGAAAGKLVDRGDGPFDLAEMRRWGEERTVRAAVLRHLLVTRQWPLHAKGVQLRGVRIDGHLDLEGATLRCPLLLESCYLDASEAANLKYAAASSVTLIGCRLAGFTGEMLTAKALTLSCSTFTGPLRLAGVSVAGSFRCSGAQLTGRDEDGYAPSAYKSGYALSAYKSKVGDVFLGEGFTASAVELAGAEIAGSLSCSGAQLTGRDEDGYALTAAGIKVGGDVHLGDGFTAEGGISLISARFGGSLEVMPTRLAGNEEDADQDDDDEEEVSLDASNAQITGALHWLPAEQVRGQVNLEGAAAGELKDDWTSCNGWKNGHWPCGGRLNLDGFTYVSLGGYERTSADQRLTWIRSQYRRSDTSWQGFATQPYEQLAAVYRHAGQDDQARKVAIARRADLRKYGNLNRYRRFGNWFLDWSIKYGYQTWRAATGLAALFVVFLALSILAQHQHAIVPIGEIEGLHPAPSVTQCMSNYPCFYPVGYTIDTVIPIINVHQTDYWGPDGHAPWGWAWLGLTWVVTGLGWALATLLVAGYTGLVRRD